MNHYTLDNKPIGLIEYKPIGLIECRKNTTIHAVLVDEPFSVDTQEGVMLIGPETVDDWNGGYVVAYPGDGSKPYAMSPVFFRANYETVD